MLLDYPNFNYLNMDQNLAGMSDPQAMGCIHLKIAINVAQHQIVNLLQTHYEVFFVCVALY